MFYHGYFTHPDLWMMWFAVLVSFGTVISWLYKIVRKFL